MQNQKIEIRGNNLLFTETVFTSVEPKRALKIADECLLEIRMVESHKKATGWLYEYEVKGEGGRAEKFQVRLKSLERT
jgi:hypothetical protein